MRNLEFHPISIWGIVKSRYDTPPYITTLAGLRDLEISWDHMDRGYIFWVMLLWSENENYGNRSVCWNHDYIANILANSSLMMEVWQ